jgi:predicted transcriptional regulator
MPVGMIVGEFDVDDVLVDRPCEIWNQTKFLSGVEETFFKQYFQGREKGYAIKIGKKKRYRKPVNPKEFFDSFVAPQSFRYLDMPVSMG